ncbi:hypothetical protein D3C72_1236850 [compost metagenome]
MDPKPSSRNFRRERVRAHLLCARCGSRAPDGAAFCGACGQNLIVPEESLVRLGSEPAAEPRAAHPREPRRVAWRRLALMAGLGAALAVAVTFLPGAFGQGEPRLAGVKVGDGPQQVERTLGAPEDRGTEVFWQGVDGASHRMIQWQYGLDETQIADLTVTFVDGKVHQVGALAGSWETSEGLKIGDRLAKADRLYGTGIEDTPIEGLTPHRFIRGHAVVRVITEAPSDEILAIGVESPKQIPLESRTTPSEPDWQHPTPSEPDATPPVVEDAPLLPRQRYY